jgi:hypothetical protein
MIPPAFQSYDDAVEEIDEGWDGSQENPLPAFCNFFYQMYVTYLAKSVDVQESALSSSDEEWEDMFQARHLTRKEKKAVEKEVGGTFCLSLGRTFQNSSNRRKKRRQASLSGGHFGRFHQKKLRKYWAIQRQEKE